jgi:ADP-heptose:LPS heptosyltransferase
MTRAAEPMLESEPRRIHLYRPQNQLGDLLLNVPAIRAIRERFPASHITLIVGEQNAPAVLGQSWADEIRIVRTRNFAGVLRESLRPGPRPDLAVYFTTVSYSKSAAYLVRTSRARARIGFDPGYLRERDRAGLTHAIPYPERRLHQSEISQVLARAIGVGAPPPPPYYVADPRLASSAPAGAVYLHPGAGKLKNRWPAARFSAVAREFLARGAEVHWVEGPQDPGCVEEATRALGRRLPVVSGEPIPRLAARFARGALYVGNDTGPLHLAAATGCPTVGIYGWSDPEEWAPVGRCVRSVRAPDEDLDALSVDRVLTTAWPLLEVERCASA